ncbi:MAG: hypothetical protein ACKPKO_21245, partial [Candidatus Fonsibacter sp.]
EFYEVIWYHVAGDSPETTEQDTTEQVPPTDDVWVMHYLDDNWQEMPDEGGYTIAATEPRFLGTKCPYCQQEFTNVQNVAKYRCGHVACLNCFDHAVHRGWHRCTYCRRSGTARTTRAMVEPVPDEDLGVFIKPENGAAAVAAATET